MKQQQQLVDGVEITTSSFRIAQATFDRRMDNTIASVLKRLGSASPTG
jgi:hypothetical protein